jgi:single-strand DNA-binding protein
VQFIHIAGRLGKDPETRFTQTGTKVTTLTVATNSRKGGQDVTIWWKVTIWDDQFKNMLPHLKKGSGVMVFGELQKPEIFTDREGKPQVSLDIRAAQIQFSPFGKPEGSQGGTSATQESRGPTSQQTPSSPYMGGSKEPQGATFDDEVPF